MSQFSEANEDLQAQNSMTIDQMNKIKDDIKNEQPLVSSFAPIYALKMSYADDSVLGFLDGITFLENNYKGIYLIRGDGNCFYRSFIFSYAESILQYFLSKDPVKVASAVKELNHFKLKLKYSYDFLLSKGHSEVIIELFYDELICLFESLPKFQSVDEMINKFFFSKDQSPTPSDSICCYLRILTSAEMKENEDLYWPFLFNSDHPTMEHYCLNEVEPVDKEVEMINITALNNFFFLNFNILYLDRNCTEVSVPVIQFKAEEMHRKQANGSNFDYNQDDFVFTLLYRPGHYDSLI